MRRTVLITGAGGFIARFAVREFAAAGWRTVGIGRSDPDRQAEFFDIFHRHELSGVERIAPLLDRCAPDAIVHLAAPSSVPQSVHGPLADFERHVVPTANLLEAMRISASPARVIVGSSAAVYGNPAVLPVNELASAAPISPYGFHKLQQEILLNEYAQLHGIRGCNARIFSTYGEHLRRLAVWDVTRRAMAGGRSVLGTGDETRDYLYAADVARALICIAENAECRGEAINIGSGQEVSIRSLALEIFRLLGIGDDPEFTGTAPAANPLHWRADIGRLHALGFTPGVWSAGLPRTVEWIRTQP